MVKARNFLAAGVGLAFAMTAPRLFAEEAVLKHSVQVDLEHSPQFGPARWVNGFLPKYARPYNGEQPYAWLLDRNGKEVIPKTLLAIPEASTVFPQAATADAKGNLYVSVDAWTSGLGTAAICKVTRGGGSMRVIRTGDFLGMALAATPSGELWVFGLPQTYQTIRHTNEEYSTLERFDASGKRMEELLPRSGFGADVIPTLRIGGGDEPYLLASDNRLGLYSATADRWVEFDLNSGRIVTDLVVARPADNKGGHQNLAGMVMTGSNEVYAKFRSSRAAPTEWDLYKLDRGAKRWIPIDRGPIPPLYRALRGAEGDDLIILGPQGNFAWIPSGALKPK